MSTILRRILYRYLSSSRTWFSQGLSATLLSISVLCIRSPVRLAAELIRRTTLLITLFSTIKAIGTSLKIQLAQLTAHGSDSPLDINKKIMQGLRHRLEGRGPHIIPGWSSMIRTIRAAEYDVGTRMVQGVFMQSLKGSRVQRMVISWRS